MLHAEHPREAAAVGGELQVQPRQQPGLQGGEAGLEIGDGIGDGEEGLGVGGRLAHAACAGRRIETITDFEVGVSLSLPKDDRGTRTLSSG